MCGMFQVLVENSVLLWRICWGSCVNLVMLMMQCTSPASSGFCRFVFSQQARCGSFSGRCGFFPQVIKALRKLMGMAAFKHLSLQTGRLSFQSFYFICPCRVIWSVSTLFWIFGSCMYRTWGFQTKKNNINNVILLQWYTLDPSPGHCSSRYYGDIYFQTMLKSKNRITF